MQKNKCLIIILVLALLSVNLFGQSLIGQYRCQNTATTTNQIQPHFNIINNSGSTVSMSDVTIRYYYSKEGSAGESFWCDYAVIGSSNVHATFYSGYVEIYFSGGSISAGGQSGQIQIRWAKTNWTNYDQSNDQSFNPSMSSFQNWDRIEVYLNGSLVWPGGTPNTPTPTPTQTPTPTPTQTPTPTPTTGTPTPTPTQDIFPGAVYMVPAAASVNRGGSLGTTVMVDTGSQNIAAFGINVSYASNLLNVSSVNAATSDFSFVVNTGAAGSIVTAGFATQGVGPSSTVELFDITWTGVSSGTSTIGISVDSLTDSNYNNVGSPSGINGTITVN